MAHLYSNNALPTPPPSPWETKGLWVPFTGTGPAEVGTMVQGAEMKEAGGGMRGHQVHILLPDSPV